ncbi:MAG: PEP-CTERM sorting domain-containing protein [Kiritimatiellales bacterium]
MIVKRIAKHRLEYQAFPEKQGHGLFRFSAIPILVMAMSVDATIVSYTVSGWGSNQYPAPTIPPNHALFGVDGYPGDTLEMVTYTGTLDLIPGIYYLKINTLNWTIDYTYGGTANDPDVWSDLHFDITAGRNITFAGGSSGLLSQDADLDCTFNNDYLSLDTGGTGSFMVQGYQVDVTPQALSPVGGSNFEGSNPWIQPQQDILARFEIRSAAVPEPASASMAVLVLIAGFWIRRRFID